MEPAEPGDQDEVGGEESGASRDAGVIFHFDLVLLISKCFLEIVFAETKG